MHSSSKKKFTQSGNIDDLESHLKEFQETSTHCSCSHCVEISNLIEICKHKKISSSMLHGIDKVFYDDDSEHTAFLDAIRSGNMIWLKKLIFDEYNNLETLDDILSKAYDELKLKNVQLSEETKVFVESQLIDLRFFSNNTKELTENSKPRLDNIKERIRFVVENIDLLSDEYSDEPEIDDRFLFLAKFIAQNIFVLKRHLRSTYKSLPWEEIEFCLICFTLSHIKQHKHSGFYLAILNKTKLLKYLKLFSGKLQEEGTKLQNKDISKSKNKLPGPIREDIVANIIRECPQFEELYKDYQQIRDIHSLTKMKEYIELSLEIDPQQKQGQLVIKRALTVISEHTKNILLSPKLSKDTCDLLLFSLSSNTTEILAGLRNSLADLLFQRNNIENNKDVNIFIEIQEDCERLRNLIAAVLYQSKINIIKHILEEITNEENFDRTNEMLNTLMRCEDEIEAELPIRNLEKIENLIATLRRAIFNPTDYETKEFEVIDGLIELGKSSPFINRIFKTDVFKSVVILNDLIKNPKTTKNLTKTKSKILLNNIFPQIYEVNTLRTIWSHCFNIFESFESREQTGTKEFSEILKLILQIDFICNSGTNDVKFIKEFKTKLNQKDEKKINSTKANDEDATNLLDSKILELRHELENGLDSSNKTKNYLSFKCDRKLQAVVEVLVLDILNIIDGKKTTCVLEDNVLSYNDSSPLLTGKSLCDHLAHDNGITDLLLADPSLSIFLNANKLITEALIGRLGRTRPEDLTRVRNNYDCRLAIISNQTKMFIALKNGSFDDFLCCLKEGADIDARCSQMRTTMHYAVIGGNPEIAKFLINKHASEVFRGRTISHCSAEYKGRGIVNFLKNQIHLKDELTELKEKPLHVGMNEQNVSSLESLEKSDIPYRNYHVKDVLKNKTENEPENSQFLLHLVSKSGNLTMVEYLLKKGLSVRAKNNDKETPLHLAAKQGHLDVVNFLIKNKAKVNSRGNKGQVPLHFAAQNGHIAVVETLIKHGADLNVVDAFQKTPLFYSIARGCEKLVDIFLKNRAKTNLLNEIGQTPLHLAVSLGNPKIINALLKSCVEINFRDQNGNTPLHMLAGPKHSCAREIVEILFINGADINAKGMSYSTPLHLAAFSGNTELVECLITHGAEVNARDIDNARPLHKAAHAGNIDVVKILVENAALINAKDKVGFTPLFLSADRGYTEIVKYLLENKAEEEKDSNFKRSALAAAILHGKVDVVEVLLKHKSQINDIGILDGAALLVAVETGHKDIIEILFANGANVFQDTIKDKLLLKAIRLNRLDIIKLLVSNGANVNGESGEPIYEAVLRGYNDIVEYLLENKASLYEKVLEANINLLGLAVSRGHKDVVSTLIKKGADVNAANHEGLTPLHLSVIKGYNEITELLIDKVENINLNSVVGTPLHIAVTHNNIECVKILINTKNADINIKASFKSTVANGSRCYEYTPLHLSVEKGCNKTTKILIENGADVNANSVIGTPLHIAVAHNNLKCVKILKEIGKAEMNIKALWDFTILHAAAEQGSLEMVEYLVNNGSDINAKLSTDAECSKPIHIAAKCGFENIVEFFFDKGLRVDERDFDENTPLHLASQKGQLEVVKYLISVNADLDDQNLSGSTPLHYAAASGHIMVVELLLHNGAMYNAINFTGKNALEETSCSEIVSLLASTENLFEAVKENNIFMVRTSLEKGAIINSKNREGLTTLYYATCKGLNEIVGILLENKANPNGADKNGFTPLYYALKFCHLEITKMLLLNGASYGPEIDSLITLLDLSQHKNIADLLEIAKISYEKTTRDMINAVSKGDEKCLKDLLARGTDVNKICFEGKYLLHYAIHNERKNFVRILLSKGAKVAQATNKGNTPLHMAVSKNNKEIVDILLQHSSRCRDNVFLDAKTTKSGFTALHIAAKNNSLDIIKALLKNGAAYDATNQNGEIPCSLSNDEHVKSFLELIENLFSFVKCGNLEAITILKTLNNDESLAAINTRNNEGHTLLLVAIRNQRKNIKTQLLSFLRNQK